MSWPKTDEACKQYFGANVLDEMSVFTPVACCWPWAALHRVDVVDIRANVFCKHPLMKMIRECDVYLQLGWEAHCKTSAQFSYIKSLLFMSWQIITEVISEHFSQGTCLQRTLYYIIYRDPAFLHEKQSWAEAFLHSCRGRNTCRGEHGSQVRNALVRCEHVQMMKRRREELSVLWYDPQQCTPTV